MHKWKLFKKSAALVLSSAVIASGVPVTAMASEAEVFSEKHKERQHRKKERTRIRSLFPRISRKLVKLIFSRKSQKKVMQKLFRKK